MSPADIAVDMLAQTADWMVEEGKKEQIPVGLTWAPLVEADTGSFDQNALDRANGQAMEAILEDIEDAEYDTVAGHLVVRILDDKGHVTPEGLVSAEVMAALSDYPVINEEILSEVEQLGVDAEVEELERELERGYLWVWDGRRNTQLDLGDGPTEKQIGSMWERYYRLEPETPYDDRGYAGIDRALVARILDEMGLVLPPEANPRLGRPVRRRRRRLFW